jgi:cytochrome c oxidase cbb3-type subunit 3
MPRTEFIKNKILPTLAGLFAASSGMGQTTAPAAQTTASAGSNMLETLLIIMMIVLVFVIWGLGRVLMVLARQVIEKNKKVATTITLLLTSSLLLASQSLMAQDSTNAAAKSTIPNYGGLSSTTFYLLVIVFITELIIILFLAFFIRRFSADLLPQKQKTPARERKFKNWWSKIDKKLLTRAIPVEQEADVMLDHDYDGIKELDNPLPPWWKYGFYVTIGVAVVYLLIFHVFGIGKNPTQEYNAEMDKARIEKELYDANNKDKIDENNVHMADAAGLAQAKVIFEAKCFVCHGKLGEGGVGPNLTDNYWLHKGSLNDIYKSIDNGYPDKGMQSWATEFSPKVISYLASYVKTLHGTNPPNAKAPQGDLYVDSSSPSVATDSSGSVKGDTSKLKK